MLHDLVTGRREIKLELGWKLHCWNQPSLTELEGMVRATGRELSSAVLLSCRSGCHTNDYRCAAGAALAHLQKAANCFISFFVFEFGTCYTEGNSQLALKPWKVLVGKLLLWFGPTDKICSSNCLLCKYAYAQSSDSVSLGYIRFFFAVINGEYRFIIG